MSYAKLVGIYKVYGTKEMKSLSQAYERPSQLKKNAYQRCLRDMMEHNGGNGSVIFHNSYCFTFGYTYLENEGSHFKKHFVYITASERYDIVVDEFDR